MVPTIEHFERLITKASFFHISFVSNIAWGFGWQGQLKPLMTICGPKHHASSYTKNHYKKLK
jgi:hypothetical protein